MQVANEGIQVIYSVLQEVCQSQFQIAVVLQYKWGEFNIPKVCLLCIWMLESMTIMLAFDVNKEYVHVIYMYKIDHILPLSLGVWG